jgi:hypothetical protein
MGFIDSGATFTIKGKLTPVGRQLLITNTNTLINTFALGDSDADYTVFSGLTNGQIPDFSGDKNTTNNGGGNYNFRSVLYYNGTTTVKPVETSSLSINTSFNYVGVSTVYYSAGTITQNKINRLSGTTDALTNLFYSLGLPKTAIEQTVFTGTTLLQGGYADTALSGISQDSVLVLGLKGSEYGEIIDGKSLKISLTTTGGTYDIYGTFENQSLPLTTYDNSLVETAPSLAPFGNNRVLLFSDGIAKPNQDSSKSWATGYATTKPFSSVPKKEIWNLTTNSTLSLTADTPVGIAYLDKGFFVITHPTIVNAFKLTGVTSTATTIEFNSVNSSVSQQITCIADRNTFVSSTNPTFTTGETPRITEIGLFDATGNLIAIAKTNRTYYKPSNDIVIFNILIEY